MKVGGIQALARERGERPGRRTKRELVRHLLQAERNRACFQTGRFTLCEQTACLWWVDCK